MEWLGRDALFVAGGAAVGLVLAVWAASALWRTSGEPTDTDGAGGAAGGAIACGLPER
jgi:hypothetical protein